MEGSDGREVQNPSYLERMMMRWQGRGLSAIGCNYGSPHRRRCATCVVSLVGAVLGVDGSDDVPNVVL